ncbi:MAG: endopeptidase La [Piscirickettsiaceae bacterium CG_4_9_14_3_um_filter_43_564]|nr:endopeptidase La [Thiomicrospira sp.]PIQ04612.1 MAG: endopeptidase La [Piscirickettsiaceae bacterium CG18_big_fil_WC_8_21_14_2_50_44_103]PIU39204.1 MAG: endopeptidase La [Piscirickettsiaceae bacterium CG07_land_8_20_14_0_80_44_28]PIW57850.1 MAG: endopeptidase La [Piscirickettsiaceae bacterium CG12_big_fil_rev_8_21_14_0_65_44_934]PIW77663.1 MAG: endopeptidase La [Piscirickettsiaceae bacterium CG_4_8_14_3_um_filter_44_38]PIX79351.1 MAG: endopeptidase La [Piscirickettsiaceae bacterium CG_4_10_
MTEDLDILEGEHLENSATGTEMVRADANKPDTLFLLPVKERPFFPGQTLPIILDKAVWGDTFKKIIKEGIHYLGIIYVDAEDHSKAIPEDFAQTGTLIRIHDPKIKSDYIQLIAEGLCRFQITQWIHSAAPYQASVTYPADIRNGSLKEFKAYGLAIMNAFKELLPLNPLYSEELKYFLNRYSASDSHHLADFAASLTAASNEKLQDLLDTLDLVERLEKVLALFKHEIEVTKLQFNIRERVEENLNQQQRDFFLRQQLKEIQKELGMVKDERTADAELFEERIEKLTLSSEARKKADEELNKIKILDPQSPEYGVARNWLDWLTQLPWGQLSHDKLDLTRARKILNKGHDGLEDVKDRIVEFLAVGALKGEISGSIICLVGPPGVGKTSIGRSIADALGRKFYRFSVGGMRDEAEIKGHRRTYIGAMPGKFIQALKDCGTANPVIMLDEIDKIGASYQGDPASALLEVLDSEQNSDFMDHFMDCRFDLSKTLFICTANTLDTVPHALLDRMEVIRLSGYITEEKIQIAKHHLWPTLLKEAGLAKNQLKITPATLRHIIEGYAREAGVRNLKKQLAKLIRKLAIRFVKREIEQAAVHIKDIEPLLGKPRFVNEKPSQQIGTVTGLAWTSMGGTTLTIEASRIHTLNRGFKLSGQLGEVMQESAGIAYSFITSNLEKYKADPEFFDKAFVHLHVPDGATPKDGPSAGITMATALLSLARNEAIKTPLAMTGELSLTGQVLPVGGIREKVIAARRVGIKQLILPEDNRKDYEELPDYLKKGMQLQFAKHFDEVARLTFAIRSQSNALKQHLTRSIQTDALSTP